MKTTDSVNASLRLWACCLFLVGCGGKSRSPEPKASQPVTPVSIAVSSTSPIRFENVAQKAGIGFTLGNGGRSPLTILEASGGGCAFLDYDSDGWPDILLVGPHRVALYHNEHNGTFKDVTAQSGLASNRYWMGCTVGDYDGDCRPDIFLTGYHCFALYRNLGDGKFQDVTRQSGIGGLDWSTSAAFADLTGSGRLDLFVSQYVRFDSTSTQICEVDHTRSACGPEAYPALTGRLFRNLGQGKFQTVPWKDTGKTWGVLASDLLGTGHPALYEADDMEPGDFWTRQGTAWKNVGAENGTGLDEQGGLQGGMGVDSGDYRNEGRLSLVVTTYFAQSISLYHNDGAGLFTVMSCPSNLGPSTTPYVKFGVGFVDLDNDGWLDLMLTSGHVRDNVHDFDAAQTYAQPLQIFHNRMQGQFEEGSAVSGVADLRAVGRGMAFADYDHDGKVDALVCNLEGRALLLHNITPTTNHWLEVRLRTSRGSNRFGLGALVTAKVGNLSMLREIRTSGSVLSAQDPVAHFGLGSATGPVDLTVRWPDGKQQHLSVSQIDTSLTITAP